MAMFSLQTGFLRLSALVLSLGLGMSLAEAALEERSEAYGAPMIATEQAKAKRLERQRDLYQQALKARAGGRTSEYQSLRDALRDYPLYLYLEYEELRRGLSPASAERVQEFLDRYPNTPLSAQLRSQWLGVLAKAGQWQEFLVYYSPKVRGAEMTCHYLWARFKTGEQAEALAAVPDLWLTGSSLPNACDPLLETWRRAGGLTPELVRQRIGLAVKAGNWSLANYLARDLPKAERELMRFYRQVYDQPHLLEKTRQFQQDSELMRQIVQQGLERLIRRDTEAAARIWPSYRQSLSFAPEESAKLTRMLALHLATSFYPQAKQWLLQTLAEQDEASLHEWLVRVALRKGDWAGVQEAIQGMPEELRHSPRWQYWLARALEQGGEGSQVAEAESIYAQVAQERDYYGFLAADRIGTSYRLNHRPLLVDPGLIAQMEQKPGLQRAREFFLLGQLPEARREWHFATRGLASEELLAVSHLVQQWGWHSQSMMGAIAAREWDDLQVRFPLVYQDVFQVFTRDYGLDINWVLALARQESAFVPDARSSKGALGVLQLLPATAKQTARSIGIGFKGSYELLDPETNIKLGTAHLRELLERFGNNRILATAAYNAGAGKVYQWLRDGGDQLPYDVWIETLPYYETRGYVQNVLTYSVIYGYRQGKKPRLLDEHEIACVCLK